MSRPAAEAGDYRAVRDLGEASLLVLAHELVGTEVAGVMRDSGLLSVGVLDSLVDESPEVRFGVLTDAVGTRSVGLELAWEALLRSAIEPARRRRRLFARAPPEVGVHWAFALGVDTHRPPPAHGPGEAWCPPVPGTRRARWAVRSRQVPPGGEAHPGLDVAEAAERARWAQAAADLVVEARLPVAELASRVLGGPGSVRSVFGGRRLRTLRLRVRGAQRLLRWIAAAGLGGFPRGEEGVRSVLAYVADLVACRASRSSPSAAVHALRFFEARGGIEDHMHVSSHPLVLGAVAEAEAALSPGSPLAVRKAAHYPFAVIAALERHVQDEEVLPYIRVFAWFRLVLVWTASRSDDLRRVAPSDVSLSDGVLEVRLRRTKTTGPDKRITVAFAWIGPGAWVQRPGWLADGFALFQSLSVEDTRDYLVPLPTRDLRGCRRAPAGYAHMLEMGRALLVDLKSVAGVRLLSPEAALLWSEHSGRAVLPTWGAALGEPSSVLDRLGRWSDGRAAGYVRANRSIIVCAQARIADGARAAADPAFRLSEAELVQRVRVFLVGRGSTEESAEGEVASLVLAPPLDAKSVALSAPGAPPSASPASSSSLGPGGGVRLESSVGCISEAPCVVLPCGSLPPVAVEAGGSSVPAPLFSDAASGSDEGPPPDLPVGTLVIAVTLRSKRRTLHRIPGCGRRPGSSYRDFVVLGSPPSAADYTQVCRGCWPTSSASSAARLAAAPTVSSSSSTGRSSESSSSSEIGCA